MTASAWLIGFASVSGAAAQRGAADADAPVVSMQLHPAIRALTATLDNGVRVHHRFMPHRKGQATVEIAFAAGRLDEHDQTLGATESAVGALTALLRERLGAETLTMAPIHEHSLAIAAWATPRAARFRVAGPTDRLAEALAMLAQQIESPTFGDAHLEQFVESRIARQRRLDEAFFRSAWSEIQRALHPGPDAARLARTPIDTLERFTASDAQRWLRNTLAQAPIEVAIVGDASRAQALGMMTATLGALPKRAMSAADRLASTATMPRPAGLGAQAPIVLHVDAASDDALVYVFLETPDTLSASDEAALEVFAQALPSLLQPGSANNGAADGGIRAYHRSAGGLFEKGLLAVHAFVPVDKAQQFAARASAALAEESLDQLDDAALAQARAAVAKRHSEQLRDPQAWTALLVDVGLQGLGPDRIADALDAVASVRARDAQQALRAALAQSQPGRIIVMPAQHAETTTLKEDDPTDKPSHPPGAGG